ncbi:hypothetical protein NUKP33_46350 [Klebsiella variicola]|nr:hypothetical protein NUKP33_46350 [Klebsiella variicola]
MEFNDLLPEFGPESPGVDALMTLAQIQGGDQLQELRQIIDVKNAR